MTAQRERPGDRCPHCGAPSARLATAASDDADYIDAMLAIAQFARQIRVDLERVMDRYLGPANAQPLVNAGEGLASRLAHAGDNATANAIRALIRSHRAQRSALVSSQRQMQRLIAQRDAQP